MSGGGNGRSEGAEKLSSITEPTTLFAPVNYDDFMVSNVGDSNSFIDLHLDAPMTIFPSLETRHKRNAAKRRKREKITPIHHLTTSIEVISKTLLAEGKLIPRVRAKSSAVAVVEEEEDDLDDDEDEDDADEDEDEEYDSPQLPYHFSEPSPFHAQQSSQPWPVQQASAPSQITLSEPVPQQIRSVPPVPPVPAGKPTVQEIRPVGRPRTAHLKPEGEKRPRGRPRKNAEHYGVTPYTTAPVPSNNGVYAAFMGSMAVRPPPPLGAAAVPLPSAVPTSAVVKSEAAAPAMNTSADHGEGQSSSFFSTTFLH